MARKLNVGFGNQPYTLFPSTLPYFSALSTAAFASSGSADPYATRGPQSGDVWVDGTVGTDGSGTQASPWKVLTAARVQAMSAGQALWVGGTVQWPDVPLGTGPSGTSGSHIMCKAWPSRSGTFNFPQIRTPGVGTSGSPGSAACSGGGYYWDWVGLGITCLDSGLYLGDITGGTTNASHFWRFIDCVGIRSGSTYTDNQGIIFASEGVGIQVIRGSYIGPAGESLHNQANLWFDQAQNLLILGVLVDQAAVPIYFKHTSVNSASTPGGVVQNCIIRNGGRGMQASLNYVTYVNCVWDNCALDIDESGGGIAGGNNCTITNSTFHNSNISADITDSGTHQHLNNTLTSLVLNGASQWEDDPSGSVDQGNVIDYTAASGTTTQHYQRNHTGYNTASAYHAVYATQEIHGLNGTIQFVGGSSGGGTTPSGWALAPGSFGTAANGQSGLNGADRGVNAANLLTVN